MRSSVLRRAKALIREHEGYREKPYRDHLGNWTAGIGHLIGDEDPPHDDPCWRDAAHLNAVFDNDFQRHAQIPPLFVGEDVFEELPEDAQIVLLDLAFNLGETKLLQFRRLREGFRERAIMR